MLPHPPHRQANRLVPTRVFTTQLLLASLFASPHLHAGTTITNPYAGMTRHSVTNASVNGRSVDYEIVVVNVLENNTSFFLTPDNGAASGETTTQTTKNFASAYSTELAINTHFYSNSGSAANVTGIAASNGTVYSPFETVGGLAALNISPLNFAETVTGIAGGTSFASSSSTPYTAISTGSMLYRDGVILNLGAEDHRARTQIGVSRNGAQLIFFASSDGMTEQEGAGILVNQFGAFHVHGMDGGGSTTMVLRTGASTQTVIAKEGVSERAVGANLGVQAGAYVAGIPDTMSWDANTSLGGIQQGSGTWNFANSNWSASGSNRTWANTKTAIFGPGGGTTIALDGHIAVNDLSVEGGYTFGSNSSQVLTVLGTLTTNGTAPTTIQATLGNSTSFTKQGSQTLVLGTGSRISMLNIDEGTIDLSGQGFEVLDPLTPMTMKGGVVQNGSLTFTGTSSELNAISGETTLNVNVNANKISKTGTGAVTLGGTNSWTGVMTIEQGILRLTPTSSLPSTAGVLVNAGTLDLNGATSSIGSLGLGGASASTSTVTIGSGALHLAGNITYTATANPNGALISGEGGGILTLNNNRIFTVGDSTSAAADLTISAVIQNNSSGTTARNLGKAGPGTLYLTGANTYSGTTTLTDGTLKIGNNSALGLGALTATAGTVDLNGFSLTVGAFSGAAGVITNNAGTPASLTTSSGSTVTFSGTLEDGVGGVGLTKASTGTLTLTGNNSYSGKTSIQGGAISASSLNSVSGGAASSNLGAPSTEANGTIDLGAATATGNLIYTGTGETTDRVVNLAGTTGGGTLTVSGTGPLKFTSDMTASGAGLKTLTLQGSTTGTGEIAGAIVNSASGDTRVTKTGTGTWTLSGSNTYTGLTSVTGGTLILDRTGGTLSDTAALTINGGILNLAQSDTVGAVTLTNGSITGAGVLNGSGYTVNNTTGTTILSVALGGSGNLTKTGAGTLVLSGDSTRNGTTTVSAGTLSLGRVGGTLADGAALTVSGTGTLDVANSETLGAMTVSGGVVSGAGTLTTSSLNVTNTAGTTTISANLAGTGNLTKSGGGATIISGANSFSGKTSIQAGSVTVSSLNRVVGGTSSSSLGAPTTPSTGTIDMGSTTTSGTLIYTGTGETTDRVINLAGTTGGAVLDQSGSGNLRFDSNLSATGNGVKTVTLQGSTSGTGELAGAVVNSSSATNLIKTGTGTWTLSGTNTHTGSTIVNGGTLHVSGTINTTSGVLLSNQGSTLNYTNNSIGLNRNVTLNAGSLLYYNSSQPFTGTLTNNGGTVGGSGNFGNSVLGGSGSLDPGNSPGILTTGGVDPTGGQDYNFEFTLANASPIWSNAAASGNDVLRLTSGTPFTGALSDTNGNIIRIYLNVPVLTLGDSFTGGFYTDNNASFLSQIAGAEFEYYLANTSGAVDYNGETYDLYTGELLFNVQTVPQTADFQGGTATGYTTQFTAVPEPTTATLSCIGLCLWVAARRRTRLIP